MSVLKLVVVAFAVLAAQNAFAMELSSPEVAQGAQLATAQVYSRCGGGNVSPALAWKNAPPETKSFAITVYDPDAQGGWWHWIVYNIPASVTTVSAGAAQPPSGAQMGTNDFGDTNYDGACPPPGSGTHHYQFTVWALGVAALPVGGGATGQSVGPYLKAHSLANAAIVATYER